VVLSPFIWPLNNYQFEKTFLEKTLAFKKSLGYSFSLKEKSMSWLKRNWPYRQGAQILFCRFGLAANCPELMPVWPGKIEVPSLLTDFHEVSQINWPENEADGYIFIQNSGEVKPGYKVKGREWFFEGPLLELSQKTSDRRFSFWGNQGFLYRLTLACLEKNHGVYSFHACGLVDETQKKLFVVAGGAGSGKTVYLLSGLRRGLKLFSTETVHFRLAGDQIEWFMGSLLDNIRLGTLHHDFPDFLPPELKNTADWSREWQTKVAVDLSAFRFASTRLISPECQVIFPHIEEGRRGYELHEIKDRRQAARILFQNISEKIASSFILYDVLPIVGFDSPELASKRLEALKRFLSHPQTKTPVEILAGPGACWANLMEA
jgi:hypothetical protein